MYLYLVQHAQAKGKEEDPQRGLTYEGRKAIEKTSHHFANLPSDIGEIIHSTKLRAKETAEILAHALGIGERISEKEGLEPLQPVLPMKTEIDNKGGNIVLVGHLPYLDRLSSLLLCGNENEHIISFRNAGIVCMRREDGHWSLEWILQPDII
ncbi:MAG: phosphohistidine phosphatase SixA [Spirochaetales bacterium]|nr:phosphohistidine phosphatase SixA [Spirochaetales bacterium]